MITQKTVTFDDFDIADARPLEDSRRRLGARQARSNRHLRSLRVNAFQVTHRSQRKEHRRTQHKPIIDIVHSKPLKTYQYGASLESWQGAGGLQNGNIFNRKFRR